MSNSAHNSSRQIIIVGGGTIGEILIQGCLKITTPELLHVIEPNAERGTWLQNHYAVSTTSALSSELTPESIIILAVKPQQIVTVPKSLAVPLNDQLLVSVMAGVPTTRLQELFITPRIVRSMPNTPARVGLGMTAWTATPAVTNDDKTFIRNLFEQFGAQLAVNNDDEIDKATAVSGSGPAYLFLVAEQLMHAAESIGLSTQDAQLLVTHTLRGASELMVESNVSASELRAQVTSPGGTTQAALAKLTDSSMQTDWKHAIQAAYARAKELAETS